VFEGNKSYEQFYEIYSKTHYAGRPTRYFSEGEIRYVKAVVL